MFLVSLLLSGGRVSSIEYQEPLGCEYPDCDYRTGLYISEYQRYNAMRSHVNFQHSKSPSLSKKRKKSKKAKSRKTGKKVPHVVLHDDKPVEVIGEVDVQWV